MRGVVLSNKIIVTPRVQDHVEVMCKGRHCIEYVDVPSEPREDLLGQGGVESFELPLERTNILWVAGAIVHVPLRMELVNCPVLDALQACRLPTCLHDFASSVIYHQVEVGVMFLQLLDCRQSKLVVLRFNHLHNGQDEAGLR